MLLDWFNFVLTPSSAQPLLKKVWGPATSINKGAQG